MSSSKMSPLMLHRTIIIFTLVTGIVHSLAKDRPNTFWSKRAEDPSFTNPTEEEGITQTFYTPRDTKRSNKNLEQYDYYPFSTIIRTLKIQRDNIRMILSFLANSSRKICLKSRKIQKY